MASPLLLHELNRERIRALAPSSLLVLPVGAVEQHGPHLPVGTDSLAVERIARTAAAGAAGRIPVLVAPTLPFGSSDHHLPWSGTMSLSTEVFFRAVSDLVRSLVQGGFRRIFLLNGHGGNDQLLQLVARDTALQHPVQVAAASYWTIAWDSLVAAGAMAPGWLPGHAGAFETSLVMADRPELVPADRPHRDSYPPQGGSSFYPPYRVEAHGWWQATDGYTDSPDRADAAAGAGYLAAITAAVAAAFVEFYRNTGGGGDGADH